MMKKYEHNHEECGYVIYNNGIPLCRLNVLPCAAVPPLECDMEGATERKVQEMSKALWGGES